MPVLDVALEILEDTGPEFAGGLANHGPMAAEALAVRLLAPYVSDDTAASALRYAWQAAAALYAAFATAPPPATVEPQALDWDDVIDQAVATGDEHAIKFAEACLREDRLGSSPAYIAAAHDAAQRLRRN